MLVSTYYKSNLKFPISLSNDEIFYLLTLDGSKAVLGVMKDGKSKDGYVGMRGRVYLENKKINTEYKEQLDTAKLNKLVEKNYLVKINENEKYQLLVPHPEIISYIKNVKNNNEGGIFSININDSERKIKNIRLVGNDEKNKLKQKSNKLGLKAHTILRKALPLGMNHHSIYQLLDSNVPCYFIVDPKDDGVYQVFPRDIFTENKNKEKVEIVYNIDKEHISIASKDGSTGYINRVKPKIVDLNQITADVKKAFKILSDNKVKTKGKSKALAILKDSSNKSAIDDYNSLNKKYWDILVKESKELIEEGVYTGGFDNNPKYKKAWDTNNKLSKIHYDSRKVRKLLDLHNSALEIIRKDSYGDMNYISYQIM